MKAIIQTQGQQFTVREGDTLEVDRFPNKEAGDSIVIEQVLSVGDGADLRVGSPFLEGASVTASLVENKRGEKIIIFKKKRRKHYRRKNGHRQPVTVLKVTGITAA